MSSRVITQVPGSKKGTFWKILRDQTGTLWCSCPAWKNCPTYVMDSNGRGVRTCKHFHALGGYIKVEALAKTLK